MADDAEFDESAEPADWTRALPLGDSGPHGGSGRQVGVIVLIVAGTIVALALLIWAGAALLAEVGDRARPTPSYSYGYDIGATYGRQAKPGEADELCSVIVIQGPHRPAPFDVADAAAGCVDAIRHPPQPSILPVP